MDLGAVRTGIAISDELYLIATPHSTINTERLFSELDLLVAKYNIDIVVVGQPKGLDGQDSDNSSLVSKTLVKLRENYPSVHIELIDERFTSKLASRSLVDSGLKKSQRQIKGELDKVSAAIILQDYLNNRQAFNH